MLELVVVIIAVLLIIFAIIANLSDDGNIILMYRVFPIISALYLIFYAFQSLNWITIGGLK